MKRLAKAVWSRAHSFLTPAMVFRGEPGQIVFPPERTTGIGARNLPPGVIQELTGRGFHVTRQRGERGAHWVRQGKASRESWLRLTHEMAIAYHQECILAARRALKEILGKGRR